jgi:hypothetical protein
MQRPALTLLAVLAAVPTFTACIIHADSHTRVSGHHVGEETLRQIEPGKKQDYVLVLLGEPSVRTALADGVEIWRWTATEKRTSSGSLIFVFDSDQSHESTRSAYVEFKDGVVTKAWRD